MPPTAKAVLVCLADYAGDDGRCWPSIDTIAVFTCFGRTAVITAIRFLESTGAVFADRSNGRHTAYQVTPDQYKPSTSRTGPAGEPVRLANSTSTAGVLDQSVSRTAPVRQADSNHQEPSRTPNKATTKHVVSIELPAWLPKRAWDDWCDHRRAIKSPMTPRAAELSIEKLADFLEKGLTPESIINNAIERGWRGLYAPSNNGPPAATGKPSAAADFRGKTYDSTPIANLPAHLRDAAERAMRDD